MPKARGGFRSEEKREQDRIKRVEHFTTLPTTTLDTLDYFPSEFVGIRSSGKAVRKLARQLYPELRGPMPPPEYVVVSEHGRYFVKLSKKARKNLPKDHPPFVIIRAIDIVSDDVQNQLIAIWNRMKVLGIKFPKHKDNNRSSSSALHAGVWHLSSPQPMVTVDTRQEHSDEVRKLLELFLALVKEHIAPLIRRLLQLYCPKVLEKQDRARQYIRESEVRDPYHQLGTVDFEGAFFTVAIKEGSSEIVHLDFNDHPLSLSWMVPVGNFQGGYFVSSQLKRVIPVVGGQVLGGMTRHILHAGTRVTEGNRLILTCFTDNTMIGHSERFHGRST